MKDVSWQNWFCETLENMEKLGEAYAEAKGTSWNLQELRKVVLASQMKLSDKKSVAAQEVDALVSEAYRLHLEGTAESIRVEHRTKAKYDASQAKFEAIRSMSSLEKAKMNLV